MQESTREKLIFAIGVLAFIIACVSFVFSALDIFAAIQAAGGDIRQALANAVVYEMIVDIVFAALELAMGLLLIKQWKDKERIEVYKTIARLISAVVYASFVRVVFSLIMQHFVGDEAPELSLNILYCIVYLAYWILTLSAGTLVRKRQLMSLYLITLITSVLAVGFCVYDCITVFQAEGTAVEIGTTIANTALMGLIVAFAAGVVAYYAKDPSALWRDVLEGEDYDVIATSDGYERVKIYATRAQEGGMNVLILLLYALCAVAGLAGIVFYALENNIGRYFGSSLQAVIDKLGDAILAGSMDEMFDLLMLLMLVFIYPLIYISQVIGAIRRQAESKISIISITSVGISLVLIASISLVVGVIFDFTSYRTIRWENYSLFEAALLVLYLINLLTKRIYANSTKEINDGILQGDSYHSHSEGIARVCLFSGIYSVVGLGLLFAMECSEGMVCVSYLLLAVSIVAAVVGACLEAKYPFSEFEYAKHKIVPTDGSGALESSDGVATDKG